jgi:hypothetical protein
VAAALLVTGQHGGGSQPVETAHRYVKTLVKMEPDWATVVDGEQT